MTNEQVNTAASDEELGRRIVLDMKAVLAEKFKAGEGIVTIGPDTPDALILLTIKEAASYGQPFTVAPPLKAIVHDELGGETAAGFKLFKAVQTPSQFNGTEGFGAFPFDGK